MITIITRKNPNSPLKQKLNCQAVRKESQIWLFTSQEGIWQQTFPFKKKKRITYTVKTSGKGMLFHSKSVKIFCSCFQIPIQLKLCTFKLFCSDSPLVWNAMMPGNCPQQALQVMNFLDSYFLPIMKNSTHLSHISKMLNQPRRSWQHLLKWVKPMLEAVAC